MIHIETGLLLIILGYLIKKKKMIWMIAGYNTSSAKKKAEYDSEALASGMGKFLYTLGGIVLLDFLLVNQLTLRIITLN